MPARAFCRTLLQISITASVFLNDYDLLSGNLMSRRGLFFECARLNKTLRDSARRQKREADAVTPRVLRETHFTIQQREPLVATPRAGCDCGYTKGTDKNKFQPCKTARPDAASAK
jgi:hypothetical protein